MSTPGRAPARAAQTARRHADGRRRCAWCTDDPLYVAYHDREWGVPVRADRRLFEMLCLEGAQAGLSWLVVLRRRDAYRRAFDGFDPERMARYGARERRRLLGDTGIVRNAAKIQAFIDNAKAYLAVQERAGSFARFLWEFADDVPPRLRPVTLGEVRQRSAQSEAMSRELKRAGFRFVGPTICYAFMQAVGMVDEHQKNCWVAARRGHAPRKRAPRT